LSKLSDLRRGIHADNPKVESSDDSDADDSDSDSSIDEERDSSNINNIYQNNRTVPWDVKNKFFHPMTTSTPPGSPSLNN